MKTLEDCNKIQYILKKRKHHFYKKIDFLKIKRLKKIKILKIKNWTKQMIKKREKREKMKK